MKKKHPLERTQLKELGLGPIDHIFDYNPETGILAWAFRLKPCNSVKAGKEAGRINKRGYRNVEIKNMQFQTSRVAWRLFYGEWPSDYIDHINGIRDDNRIVNLRNVTHVGNMHNKSISKNNTSGVCGVYFNKRDKVWRAQIGIHGKVIMLGSYASIDEAAAARAAANVKFDYDSRHGSAL